MSKLRPEEINSSIHIIRGCSILLCVYTHFIIKYKYHYLLTLYNEGCLWKTQPFHLVSRALGYFLNNLNCYKSKFMVNNMFISEFPKQKPVTSLAWEGWKITTKNGINLVFHQSRMFGPARTTEATVRYSWAQNFVWLFIPYQCHKIQEPEWISKLFYFFWLFVNLRE